MTTDGPLRRTVWSRADVGMTASVRQRSDLIVHTFVADYPSMILLRHGRKTIRVRGRNIVVLPGDAVAIAAGTTCDVRNETEGGRFESIWIVGAQAILSSAQAAFPDMKAVAGVAPLKNMGAGFTEAFERAAQTIVTPEAVPTIVAQSRMHELLAWLAHTGAVFDAQTSSDLHRKVRLMIGAAPERRWLSGDVANAFAMSEATFRRRLAQLGQSFNAILIDVRMTTALTLLQVTDRPVSEIADQVGYASASRFSHRFKQRFGFAPAAVRGAP